MGNIVTAREKTIHPQRNELDGQLIRFPHEDNSIESICVNRKDLLIPINGTDSGLYCYSYDDQNQCWFQKECLFETKSDEIIINVKSMGNTVIGCYSRRRLGIFIYNLKTKDYEHIPMDGCSTDICFDGEDENIVYCYSLVDSHSYISFLYKIHLITKKIDRICVNEIFLGAVGIHCYQKMLYLVTLHKVYSIYTTELHECYIMDFQATADFHYPYYDNIHFDVENNLMMIAVYDYKGFCCTPSSSFTSSCSISCFNNSVHKYIDTFHQRFGHNFHRNHQDYSNLHRHVVKDYVKYMIYNPYNGSSKMKEFNFQGKFDNSTVTQFIHYRKDQYVFINCKSNYALIGSVKL